MHVLIDDTTQTGTVSGSSKPFKVRSGDRGALRSTRLDGSAVITLYYDGPDGTFNESKDDDGTTITLTPTNPERVINLPGQYRVAVTSASTTKGVVFYNG